MSPEKTNCPPAHVSTSDACALLRGIGTMLSTCASSALITRLLRARLASLCLVPKPREEWRLRARCFASHRFKSTTTGDEEPRETGGQTIADDTNTAWTAHNAWTSSSPRGSLYPGHVRLTSLQKALLAVTSGIGAIAFPERADLVGTANELSGVWALQNMRDRMRKDSVGSELLRRRPRITDTTLERAHECAPGTLGKTWSTFMGTRKFDPNDRPAVRFVDDEGTSPRFPNQEPPCFTSNAGGDCCPYIAIHNTDTFFWLSARARVRRDASAGGA